MFWDKEVVDRFNLLEEQVSLGQIEEALKSLNWLRDKMWIDRPKSFVLPSAKGPFWIGNAPVPDEDW